MSDEYAGGALHARRLTRLGGPLDRWATLAAAQLDADTPYTESLIVQDVVGDPGAHRACDDYAGDLSGRYLEAAALSRLAGRAVDWDKACRVAARVVGEQRGDGSFGPARPGASTDHGVAWGNGRLLTGLMTFADAAAGTQLAADVLDAAGRLAGSIVASTPAWLDWFADPDNHRSKFALDFLSGLDPLVAWWARTGDAAARDAAAAMVSVIPEPVGSYHLHGYLLALRGWTELAAASGDAAALARIGSYWHRVRAGWILPHGGALESLKDPHDINTECCGIADWIMLTIRLAAVRPAAERQNFLDTAEIALYNALPHTQRPSGHFGCETLCADPGLLTFDYPPEAWWCCTFHGLRAIYAAACWAVRFESGTAVVDLLVDSERHLEAAGIGSVGMDRAGTDAAGVEAAGIDAARIDIATGYPDTDTVRVTATGVSAVSIRVPGTSTIASLRVDGEPRPAQTTSGYLTVSAEGPVVVELELHQAMWVASGQVRVLTPTANCTDENGPLHGRRGAVLRGPRLLGANAAHNNPDNVLRSRGVRLGIRDDRFELPAAGPAAGVHADGIGFAQEFPLILTPIAEQTGYGRDVTTRIEFDSIHVQPAG